MPSPQFPKSKVPHAKFCEFLVGEPAEVATGGVITEEEYDEKRARFNKTKQDGKEKKQFTEMNEDEKFEYLYTTGQQTQRECLQNSIRLYGVKRNDAKGDKPTDILQRICEEGLKMSKSDTDLITGSGLRSIQRVEGGKCLVFQLNREDMVRKIFEKIGNLKDFVNPYNHNVKIVFTRNLCPEDNKIRSECLSVKEILRDKGFKDIKVRFNKVLSVNGGPWHDYKWFLAHKFEEADRREKQITERQGAAGTRRGETYAKVAGKRKAAETEDQRPEAEESSNDETETATNSNKKSKPRARSADRPKGQRDPRKKSKH